MNNNFKLREWQLADAASLAEKAGYKVNVLSDCVTSYDKRKIDEMLNYYESKGSKIITLKDL
jgi:hypothetical protein